MHTLPLTDRNLQTSLRILAETVVHLNERVELLEARALLDRPATNRTFLASGENQSAWTNPQHQPTTG
jgi:hypothetical protein